MPAIPSSSPFAPDHESTPDDPSIPDRATTPDPRVAAPPGPNPAILPPSRASASASASSPTGPPAGVPTVGARAPGAPPGPAGPARAPGAVDPLVISSPWLDARRWADPVLEQFGHDPRSPYVERYWLPVLGPSTTLLMRYLADRFDDEPDGFRLDLHDVARALGMGSRKGPSAPFFRTLERLAAFGFAQLVEGHIFIVRLHMPTLTRRQLQRLPDGLQRQHDEWVTTPSETVPADMRRRARALALSLLELGEDRELTERQLHRWKFHPAIAHDAVRWALTEHELRRAGLRREGPVAPASAASVVSSVATAPSTATAGGAEALDHAEADDRDERHPWAGDAA